MLAMTENNVSKIDQFENLDSVRSVRRIDCKSDCLYRRPQLPHKCRNDLPGALLDEIGSMATVGAVDESIQGMWCSTLQKRDVELDRKLLWCSRDERCGKLVEDR